MKNIHSFNSLICAASLSLPLVILSSVQASPYPTARTAQKPFADKVFADRVQGQITQPAAISAPVAEGEGTEMFNTKNLTESIVSLEANAETPSDDAAILINKIEVLGSTVFESQDFERFTTNSEGKLLSAEELRGIADQITQLYLNNNYITSRANLVSFSDAKKSGIATIQIIEGSLDAEDIEIQGLRLLNPSYIRNRVALSLGTPLDFQALEEQLILLRRDPLISNIEASIRPSEEQEIDKSRLIILVTEANPLEVSWSVDNYSPPSIGSERLGTSVRHRNLTGNGDSLGVSFFNTATSGAQSLDITYTLPVSARGSSLQLRAAPNWTEITNSEASVLGIESNNQLYSAAYRHALIRKPREELSLSLGFTYQSGQTFIFNDVPTTLSIGPDSDGTSRTSVIQFAQDYVNRDSQGAWAARSQFNLGIGVLDATINDSPVPDGRFISWNGQLQRSQQLDKNHLLIGRIATQLTPDGLLPSQKFVIGGGQLTRGYRQNVRSGDNGFRVSLEDRITLSNNASGRPNVQLVPFFDMGMTWNTGNNPNPQPDQRFIASLGTGMIFSDFMDIEGLGLQFGYGLPLVELSDRGNNFQDDGFYFELGYRN